MIDIRQGKLSEQMAAVRGLQVDDFFINKQGQKCTITAVVKNENGDVVGMESTTTDPAPTTI